MKTTCNCEAQHLIDRVVALADHYEALAAEMPEPHGVKTEALLLAAHDFRAAATGRCIAENGAVLGDVAVARQRLHDDAPIEL